MDHKQTLPTFRLYQSEMDRIFALFAALQEVEMSKDHMRRRVASIPEGPAQLDLLSDVLSRLLDSLIATIPPKKLHSIRRMLPKMRYKVYFNGIISEMQDDATAIRIRDLHTLCKAAHEQCVLCDDNCNRCKLGLGRVFDRILKVDRMEGES